MYKKLVLVSALAPLLLTGCPTEAPVDEPEVGVEPETTYVETFSAEGLRRESMSVDETAMAELEQAHLKYALANYQSFASTARNFISSPFEQQQFINSIALGAEGTTLDHFSDLINFDAASIELQVANSDWAQKIEGLSSVTQHRYLWGQEGYIFSLQYLQNQAELYGPTMAALDFIDATQGSSDVMAEVLGEDLELTGINAKTRLVMAQLNELSADWSADLNVELVLGRFAVLDGDRQRHVDMLRIDGVMNVIETEDYRAVELPLNEPGLSMLMVMPGLGKFSSVESYFNESFVKAQLNEFSLENTTVMLPQFSMSSASSTQNIPDLGVALVEPVPEELVTPENAGPALEGYRLVLNDYSGADPKKMANFSRVNHEGYLFAQEPVNSVQFELNEQGVNSKTSHAIVHEGSVDEPRWILEGTPNANYGGLATSYGIFISTGYSNPCFYEPDQRPFLFAIYDKANNSVLHLGHVVALAGESVAADWTSYSPSLSCGDSAPVTVYRHTEGVKCESEGMSRDTMTQILADVGIEDLPPNVSGYPSVSGNQSTIYPIESCGEPDGRYETFFIRESKLELARSLGFDLLSELAPE